MTHKHARDNTPPPRPTARILHASSRPQLSVTMPRYKRSAEEAQLDVPTEPDMAPENAQTLKDLRNMWEFASLMQYIFLFGNAVKIDEDFDIEVWTCDNHFRNILHAVRMTSNGALRAETDDASVLGPRTRMPATHSFRETFANRTRPAQDSIIASRPDVRPLCTTPPMGHDF